MASIPPRRVTISDVARVAGVTPATVSRVLNEDRTLRVAAKTRARILSAVQSLQYVPNAAARALRLSTSGAVALVMHDLSNPVYSEILQGAQAAAAGADYVVVLAEADHLVTGAHALNRLLAGRRIDGLLLQPAGDLSDELIGELLRRQVPTVLINDRHDGGISSVALDDETGAVVAVQHLIALGHTEIAHITGSPSARARERRKGFLRAMSEAGLVLDATLEVTGGWDADSGIKAAKILMRQRPQPPTAIFVDNIRTAIGVLHAFSNAGLAVPSDVSIVALHDTWLAQYTYPSLTTVRMPLREMGATAMHLLFEGIEGGAGRHLKVDSPTPCLCARGSTRGR